MSILYCTKMLSLLLLISISSAFCQSLPDPPKVTVNHVTLEKFGVTIDPNEQGEFQRLMSVTPGVDSTNPHIKALAQKAKDEINDIYKNILNLSMVDFTRKIINLYKNLPEESLAQYIAAHIINMYTRFSDILNKINDDVIESLTKLTATGNKNQQIVMCTNTLAISIAASQVTREIDTRSACHEFVNMLDKDSTLVTNLVDQATHAKKALQTTNQMLEDENVKLSDVLDFVSKNPVIPKIYHTLMYHHVLDGFDDYATFYGAIEHSKQVESVMGMPLPEIKSNVASQFTEFLKRVELF